MNQNEDLMTMLQIMASESDPAPILIGGFLIGAS